MRVDRWFKEHFPALPFGHLQKLLRTGQVRVDGGRVKTNTRLASGQKVRVPPIEKFPSPKGGGWSRAQASGRVGGSDRGEREGRPHPEPLRGSTLPQGGGIRAAGRAQAPPRELRTIPCPRLVSRPPLLGAT